MFSNGVAYSRTLADPRRLRRLDLFEVECIELSASGD